MLRAVLFDMDGTLVETEQLWGVALDELAARLGGRMSAGAREQTVGTSMRTAMTVLHTDLGLPVPDDAVLLARADEVERRVVELLAAEEVVWRPGAPELLRVVRAAGLRTALVTTTPRSVAQLVLDSITAGLGGDPFDATVCGDEAPARKPDPAPYLLAMRQLEVGPRSCLVVEDSAVGVAAGVASGAAVLAVPSLQPLQPSAGVVFRDSLVGLAANDLDDLTAAGRRAGLG